MLLCPGPLPAWLTRVAHVRVRQVTVLPPGGRMIRIILQIRRQGKGGHENVSKGVLREMRKVYQKNDVLTLSRNCALAKTQHFVC